MIRTVPITDAPGAPLTRTHDLTTPPGPVSADEIGTATSNPTPATDARVAKLLTLLT
jgi:hypothetical protein